LITPDDRAGKHQVVDDLTLTSSQLGQALSQFIGRDICQKTQSPQIDAEQRDLPLAHLLGGAKYRAITAQDNGEISLVLREILAILEIANDDFRVFFDQWAKLRRRFFDAWPFTAAQQQDLGATVE
jgi:hypothetical protein